MTNGFLQDVNFPWKQSMTGSTASSKESSESIIDRALNNSNNLLYILGGDNIKAIPYVLMALSWLLIMDHFCWNSGNYMQCLVS